VIKRDISENRVKIAYLAIGSNLGNRFNNINTAKLKIESQNIKIVKSSSNYESLSWPNIKDPKFINVVIMVKTCLSPHDLLKICNKIEKELGRIRTYKNEPRTCDIDIIDFDNKIFKSTKKNTLNLPHPEAINRNFVLLPLYEISKTWRHPKTNEKINKLISLLNVDDLSTIKQV
jgi:2-amino-4-hydroxy-6-hydroxymethyldihydropteridine diphosphokinase